MQNFVSTAGINTYDVTKRTPQNSYWLNTQPARPKEELGAIKILTPEEAKKTNDINAFGLSIAGATLFVAGAIFILLKGGFGTNKYLDKMKKYFETRSQKLKLDTESNPKMLAINEWIIRAINFVKTKCEVTNNFTTLKDYTLKRFMCREKDNLGTKIHKGITNIFEKIAQRTVKNSYSDTRKMFKDSIRSTDKINGEILKNTQKGLIEINGEKQSKIQWLTTLTEKNKELTKIIHRHFSEQKVESRFQTLKQAADKLEKDFDKNGYLWFWTPEVLKSFVAETKMLNSKTKIQKDVEAFKKEVSYSFSDFTKEAEQHIIKMTKLVKFNDTKKIQMLRELRRDYKDLAKNYGQTPQEEIQKNIQKNIANLRIEIQSSNDIDPKISKELLKNLEELNNHQNFKKGLVEEILDIYKALLPKSKYEKLESLYRQSVKSLEDSIKIETEDFTNKLRDLTLGSAPTDVITLLSGFGTLGYFLLKSENTQERTGVALKYGIPALTFIGTSLYFNARLYAGTKAMFYGGIATWVIGKIGELANDIYIHELKKNGKYISQKNKNNEQKPV